MELNFRYSEYKQLPGVLFYGEIYEKLMRIIPASE